MVTYVLTGKPIPKHIIDEAKFFIILPNSTRDATPWSMHSKIGDKMIPFVRNRGDVRKPFRYDIATGMTIEKYQQKGVGLKGAVLKTYKSWVPTVDKYMNKL